MPKSDNSANDDDNNKATDKGQESPRFFSALWRGIRSFFRACFSTKSSDSLHKKDEDDNRDTNVAGGSNEEKDSSIPQETLKAKNNPIDTSKEGKAELAKQSKRFSQALADSDLLKNPLKTSDSKATPKPAPRKIRNTEEALPENSTTNSIPQETLKAEVTNYLTADTKIAPMSDSKGPKGPDQEALPEKPVKPIPAPRRKLPVSLKTKAPKSISEDPKIEGLVDNNQKMEK